MSTHRVRIAVPPARLAPPAPPARVWGTPRERGAAQTLLEGLLDDLDERSADVVRRRYGLVDGRQAKLADIGKVWGITAERVRQIERAALASMRQRNLATMAA